MEARAERLRVGRSFFAKADADGDGRISVTEIKQVLSCTAHSELGRIFT